MTNQSTINPLNPAADSLLSSSPVRANFQAAYNDINALYALVNALPRFVGTGTSDTVNPATDSFIGWNSSSPSAKTEYLLAGVTPGQVLVIKDVYGNAGTYNIKISCQGCTVDGGASFVLNYNKSAVSLKWDGGSNWMAF